MEWSSTILRELYAKGEAIIGHKSDDGPGNHVR